MMAVEGISPKTYRKVLIGNHAVAEAVKLARAQVIAAYPITPQTLIVEKLAEMVEKGELNAKFIRIDSEHSALAAVLGAVAAGARAFTATSSHGLLYMYEVVWWAANARLPMVMTIVTRSIAPPWNIHSDHNDLLTMRDSGWIISMAESVQEAFDLTLQGFKISEDERVLLPFVVGLDAFQLSHTAEVVDIPNQKIVDEWLPPRNPYIPYVLEPGQNFAVGNIGPNEYTMELRWYMYDAMKRAKEVIKEVDRDYAKIGGRSYGGLVERYKTSDAKYIVVTMGAWSGDAKEAVDELRDEGIPVGLLRLRFIRPFPIEELRELAFGAKAFLVVDRAMSMGYWGILGIEISAAIKEITQIRNIIAGLGGVDVSVDDFYNLFKKNIEKIECGEIREVISIEWYMPWLKK